MIRGNFGLETLRSGVITKLDRQLRAEPFAAHLSGLACGLALAVRPAGADSSAEER